jgi:hypothetical protein
MVRDFPAFSHSAYTVIVSVESGTGVLGRKLAIENVRALSCRWLPMHSDVPLTATGVPSYASLRAKYCSWSRHDDWELGMGLRVVIELSLNCVVYKPSSVLLTCPITTVGY